MSTDTHQPKPASNSGATFSAYLKTLRPAVEAELDRLLPATDCSPALLHQAMRYAVFAGGKRVRPALVMLTADTLGVEPRLALPGAAALEMIHTYSLVHDDLPALDDDDLRRGRATVHRRWDEATAILVGDSLLTLGLQTLAAEPADLGSERRRRATAEVGRVIGSTGMIGGQVDDLLAERQWPDDPPAMLEAIHRRKTGALLRVCIDLAGIYAGAEGRQANELGQLGDLLGLMFQIADDILDIEGTDETLGKTAGKDAAARKLTYPGLHGLEKSKRLLRRTRDQALELARDLPAQGGLFPSLISYLSTRDR